MAQKSRRETGSTPVVGSSSSSTRGVWISAQIKPSFCFMPPESCPASRRSNPVSPAASQQFLAARDTLLARHAEKLAHRKRCSRRLSGLHRARSAVACSSSATWRASGSAPTSMPSTVIGTCIRTQHASKHAHDGGLARAIGADQTENLARFDAELDAANRMQRAEAFAQRAHLHGELERAHFPAGNNAIVASAGMPGSSSWFGLSMSIRMR